LKLINIKENIIMMKVCTKYTNIEAYILNWKKNIIKIVWNWDKVNYILVFQILLCKIITIIKIKIILLLKQ
jgi:hypothetical protein